MSEQALTTTFRLKIESRFSRQVDKTIYLLDRLAREERELRRAGSYDVTHDRHWVINKIGETRAEQMALAAAAPPGMSFDWFARDSLYFGSDYELTWWSRSVRGGQAAVVDHLARYFLTTASREPVCIVHTLGGEEYSVEAPTVETRIIDEHQVIRFNNVDIGRKMQRAYLESPAAATKDGYAEALEGVLDRLAEKFTDPQELAGVLRDIIQSQGRIMTPAQRSELAMRPSFRKAIAAQVHATGKPVGLNKAYEESLLSALDAESSPPGVAP